MIYLFEDLEILSGDGSFKPFKGILASEKKVIDLKLSNGEFFSCTPDHQILLNTGEFEVASRLSEKFTSTGLRVEQVLDNERVEIVYDALGVEDNHSYFTDGLISHNCLLIDELAFVKKNIQQAMWTSLAPTLSTGGSCILSSTPNGDSDLYATLWREAIAGNKSVVPGEEDKTNEHEENFYPIEVLWNEHPDRDEEYKKQMIKKITEPLWLQEYECEFLSSDPLLINTMVLQNLKSKTPLYNDKGFFWWKEPDPNKTYIVGVDVAEGLEKDFSTIQVLELETLEQVAEYRNNTVKENQLYDAIKYVLAKIHSYVEPRTGKRPTIYWSFENNSAGAALGALYYADENFPEYAELINGKGVRLGMRTVNKTKVEACRHLKKLIEQPRGGLTINSKMMIFELKNYILTGAGYAAKRGATDDLISAFLIVLRVMKYLSEYEPEVFDKLYKTEGDFYGEASNDYDDPIPFVV